MSRGGEVRRRWGENEIKREGEEEKRRGREKERRREGEERGRGGEKSRRQGIRWCFLFLFSHSLLSEWKSIVVNILFLVFHSTNLLPRIFCPHGGVCSWW
jgi:hypothetical protein